jgi:hypothetical protein
MTLLDATFFAVVEVQTEGSIQVSQSGGHKIVFVTLELLQSLCS